MELFFSRRFFPFLLVHFCGSFNNNFFKYSFIVLLTIKTSSVFSIPFTQIIALITASFYLPCFFFSTIAGQLADKYSKTRLLIWIKFAEVFIMSLAAFGFFTSNLELLFIVIFFMGIQATFFGPLKYALLPAMVKKNELVLTNAHIQTARFSSALIGTLLAGVLISTLENGETIIAIMLLTVSIAGFIATLFQIPLAPQNSSLYISWNLIKSFSETIKVAKIDRSVFTSILGISWFWVFCLSVLTVLPVYVKENLNANHEVLTFFLVIFITSISFGFFIFNKITKSSINLSLFPVGLIGIICFTLDICLSVKIPMRNIQVGLMEFFNYEQSARLIVDLFFMAFFAGIYSLPLFALVQQRSEKSYLSRIIAANELINAFFVVASGGLIYLAFKSGLNSIDIFGYLAFGSFIHGIWAIWYCPEFRAKKVVC